MKILLKAFGEIIYTTFLLVMIFGGFLTLATQTHTIGLFSTQSGSMLPRYPLHALLVVVPADYETIREGDVIFAQKKGNEQFVMHRVVSVSDTVSAGETVYLSDDDGATFNRVRVEADTPAKDFIGSSGLVVGPTDVAVRMRGDANPADDTETYLIHSQVWKLVLQIRGGGYFYDSITSTTTIDIGLENFDPITVPTSLLWVGGASVLITVVVLLIPTRRENEDDVSVVEDTDEADTASEPHTQLPEPAEAAPSVPTYKQFLNGSTSGGKG